MEERFKMVEKSRNKLCASTNDKWKAHTCDSHLVHASPHEFTAWIKIYMDELTGAPYPGEREGQQVVPYEGRSLVPLLDDPELPWSEAAYSQFLRDNPGDGYGVEELWMGHAVRTATHRYVAWRNFETGELLAEELYDHRDDPGENRSVHADPAQAGALERGRALERERWTRHG